jgi:hypothetical protein
MIGYSVLMFAIAVVLFVLGVLIYRGKIDLIHDYHRAKVTDRQGYGKAFGKALLGLAAVTVVSGIIAFFGETEAIVFLSVAVLILGLLLGLASIWCVQKKYNGGW